jgi:DNA-binding NarL/FixJ family response regulator
MVVEDDPQMCDQITQMVNDSDSCAVVCSARTCAQAREFLDHDSLDVLLVDLELPDGSGLELISRTTLLHPGADIMVITVFGDEANVFQALENGASGYLLKDSLPDDFIGVVNLLRAGGAPINPIIARQIVKRFKRSGVAPTATASVLTEREIEILNLIARGFSTSEVAALIQLSPHTVVSHIKKVYRKLRVNSRVEALYEASLLGVLSR